MGTLICNDIVHAIAEGRQIIPGCTFKHFLDCKPLVFKGTEGSTGLIKWLEKVEAVIRISACTDN